MKTTNGGLAFSESGAEPPTLHENSGAWFGRSTRTWGMLVLGLCLVAGEALAQRQFIHPGIYHNRAELDFLKQKVLAGEQPWAGQYQAMITASGGRGVWGALDYQHEAYAWATQGAYNNPCTGGCVSLFDDGTAAYVHALQWYITGNVQHAMKSVEILNAWNILTNISGDNKELFAAVGCNPFVNAAEIMRHTWDGWSAADQAAFRNMLNTAFYPQLHNFRPTYNGNWDALITQAMIGMGVFLDDQAKFDRAVNYYRSGSGNGSLPNYVRPDGTTQETTRDQAHEQMGIAGLCGTAEIAWKQGINLYGELNNRLLLGAEGTAKRVGDGALSPFWWLPYNHYVRRAGLSAPECQRLALKLHGTWTGLSQRYRPYTLWSQWTHAYLPPFPAGYVGEGCFGVPAAPTNVVTLAGPGWVQLTWAENPCASSYTIFRDSQAIVAGVTNAIYVDTGLSNGVSYCYMIRAVSTNGPSPLSATVCAEPLPPGAPASPSGVSVQVGDGWVELAWNAVTGATGYVVERSVESGAYSPVATNGGTTYRDGGVENGTLYCYRVRAVNEHGTGPASVAACGVPFVPQLPEVVFGVLATGQEGFVRVTWEEVEGAMGYVVERALHGGVYVPVATVSASSYADAGAAAGVLYCYRVRAVNELGSGPASLAVCARTATGMPGEPEVLAYWSFGGPTTNEATWLPDVVAEHLEVGPVTNPPPSTGLLLFQFIGGNGYAEPVVLQVQPSSATSAGAAVSGNRFFSFTLTPHPGHLLTLNRLELPAARGGSSTPRGIVVRSSVDNFGTNIFSGDVPTVRPTLTVMEVPLGAAFANLNEVTFRVYVYCSSGSLEFDNVRVWGRVVGAGGEVPVVVHGIGREGGEESVVEIEAQGMPGEGYTLERTGILGADPVEWEVVRTVWASTNLWDYGRVKFRETNPPAPAFYRVKHPPAP